MMNTMSRGQGSHGGKGKLPGRGDMCMEYCWMERCQMGMKGIRAVSDRRNPGCKLARA